ncbi:SAM-dependent methyltransferase [Parafrankia sp. BMG5.11]|uniref:SAM-dependent methyltransferase n=1 Tax=Parafrankia sp. BMG5.11 TaxID=222540 RepID=UPI00103E9787|nr:SAM-dependent methyltransferase [Parafrankia sp. BMG5.11]TCJ36577.1 SAM-dependent methyltransferase [Parafrankia sp. BMG5.11]
MNDTPFPLPSTQLHTTLPHSARIYDYFLDGKDNFPADREAAEAAVEVFPYVAKAARANRRFLHRVVRYLAEQAAVDQFLDVGTGIPTSPNLHEVAQGILPKAAVVYVDNDPLVLAHARALLTSSPQGRTAYLDCDLLKPEQILSSPEVRDTLDLSRPVALTLIAVLHFVPDEADPLGVVSRLLEALPSGSYLALSQVTADFDKESIGLLAETYRDRGIPAQPRSRAEVTRFVDGLELVEPGIVAAHRWRPDTDADHALMDEQVSVWAVLARKP